MIKMESAKVVDTLDIEDMGDKVRELQSWNTVCFLIWCANDISDKPHIKFNSEKSKKGWFF